jgi:dTDP-4-dehydrorhamnose 3,5-epimerase
MPFDFIPVEGISGPIVIKPRVFGDTRGFFMESWREDDFLNNGIREQFVQDNHSKSSKGVLRGLHFQKEPQAQGKLVRVITGSVWDVAVDIRQGSPTRGRWFGLELNEENRTMFYIPPGFAHGFVTLKDNTHFVYKCTCYYSPEKDAGIRWDDPDLSITWPLANPQLSEKDRGLPLLKEMKP